MHPKRDVFVFVALSVAFSLILSFATFGRFANALNTIAVTSVILAARGIGLKRRLLFAVITLGGFAAFSTSFQIFGLNSKLAAFGTDTATTALGLFYTAVTFTYPFAVLLLVGRNPSVLWSKRPGDRAPHHEDGLPPDTL